MCAIPAGMSRSGSAEVIIASVEGPMWIFEERQAREVVGGNVAQGSGCVVLKLFCRQKKLDSGPFRKMQVSPEGHSITCFTETGRIFTFSIDFSKVLRNVSILSVDGKELK